MKHPISAVLAAALLICSAGIAVAASPPANDNFADASSIAPLPFAQVADLSTATTEAGENLDCGFPSTKTVWYRYTPSATELLSVDIAGSDADAGLRVYFDHGSGPGLAYCWQSGPLYLGVSTSFTTYFQLSVDTGSHASLSVVSLPLLTVTATIDGVGRLNMSTGTTVFTGTITCNMPANAYVGLLTAYQRQGRKVGVAQGYSDTVACGTTPTPWAVTAYAGLQPGSAGVDWEVSAYIFGPPDQSATFRGGPVTVKIKVG